MSGTNPPRRVGRSIGAGVLGLLAIVVLSTGPGATLRETGIFPPPGQPMADALWLLAVAYRAIYAVVGGYLDSIGANIEATRARWE